MIRSFRGRLAAAVFRRQPAARLAPALQRLALRKLLLLHAATRLETLGTLPDQKIEPEKSPRVGQFGIRVGEHWRLCFWWRDGDAFETELVEGA